MINKNSTSFSAPSFASYFTQEVKPSPVKMTIADIAKAIDNFDYYYEASDSDSVWSNGERSKAQIVKELRELTPEQIIAADMDKSGDVSVARDLIRLRNLILGNETEIEGEDWFMIPQNQDFSSFKGFDFENFSISCSNSRSRYCL